MLTTQSTWSSAVNWTEVNSLNTVEGYDWTRSYYFQEN